MIDVLPRMSGIVKIVVSSEDEIPVVCQACMFSDENYFYEWYCAATGKKIDFPRAKPDWCPIMVKGSTEELLFTFRNMKEKDKERKRRRNGY